MIEQFSVALAGLYHESNTFTSSSTSYDDFKRVGILRGNEIASQFRNSRHTVGGFLASSELLGMRITPVFYAHTHPSGTIDGDAFDRLLHELLGLLAAGGPWDAVLLAQHGAAVAEFTPDADGTLLRRVRGLVGPDCPIGVVYDLHANVTRAMIENATIPILYRTNPHLDPAERAVECAGLVLRTLKGEISPVTALETPPLVINIIKQATAEEPLAGLYAKLDQVLAEPGVLSASVALGYPYADVTEMGMSFIAVHDGDRAAACAAAQSLASAAWALRDEFEGNAPTPAEALEAALATDESPVVLLDVGDNIGGGSPGDSTFLLAEARRLAVGDFVETLADRESVEVCLTAGPGGEVRLAVGGKTDGRHGEPVELSGYVRLLADGRFEEKGATHGGYRFFDAGVTAVVETDQHQTLVLTSHPLPATSAGQLLSLGIDVAGAKIVVAKGVIGPQAAYGAHAARFVPVNTGGATTADLESLPYTRRRNPLYPFEREAVYPASD
jgi:microcystin degradation protein MlrC